MSDMKCPFCGKDMEITMFARGREFVSCNNTNCIISDWGGCSKQIITELIRTRKALDVAVDALRLIGDTRSITKENLYASYGKSLNSGIVFCWTTPDEIHNTLEQINKKEEK